MENLEIEYKVMLNKTDFLKILKSFSSKYPFEHYNQTNFYYDTKDEKLNKNGISLRIRNYENTGKYITTLKEKQPVGRLEHEYKMRSNNINYLPKRIIKIINNKNVDVSTLINTATLKTERKEFKYQDCLLCFDISSYYGHKDYEIECEATNMEQAKIIVLKMLETYNARYKESSLSKTARAKKYKAKEIIKF